ncbi:DUF4181 domain-containing protein [Sutcliffiella rhizosphaerae]|nr:DUF4181 domain-containing protein [Sutcliffiella rhizosphaerae]
MLLDYLLRKIFKIKRVKMTNPIGKKVDLWGRIIIVLIFFALTPVISIMYEDYMHYFIMGAFLVIMFFETFVEWKYNKESKGYITHLLFIGLFIPIFLNIDLIIELLNL